MLEDFTFDTFAGRLAERFVLEHEDGACYELVLSECGRLGGQAPNRVPFSLVFSGPVEPVLPQRIYTLRHAELGVLSLFLVPIGRDGNGTRYEAVFA